MWTLQSRVRTGPTIATPTETSAVGCQRQALRGAGRDQVGAEQLTPGAVPEISERQERWSGYGDRGTTAPRRSAVTAACSPPRHFNGRKLFVKDGKPIDASNFAELFRRA